MKPTSILMYANRLLYSLTLCLTAVLFMAAPAHAVPDNVLDPNRLTPSDEFQGTIEDRCTICHTRERVDEAMSKGEDLDTLLQHMIERGAILNERDKKVLGTFWGSPVSGDPTPDKALK